MKASPMITLTQRFLSLTDVLSQDFYCPFVLSAICSPWFHPRSLLVVCMLWAASSDAGS